MPVNTVNGLERLSQDDLLVGVPVGEDRHKLDIVDLQSSQDGIRHVTPMRRSNYGQPWHHHIYRSVQDHEPLHRLHLILNESTTGRTSPPKIYTNLGMAASSLMLYFPDSDFGERIDAIQSDFLDQEEMRRRKLAQHLSQAAARRTVFVCASLPDNRETIYAARVTGLTNIRDDQNTAFEPVVTTPAGEGLLPRNMYIYQGLYVPTLKPSN